ncbi:epoxyqueuosine reductase [bacterium BMS3Abin04]|nr:epoxyqueuosine reductase [bacterium BMS3Abin04]
MLINNYTVIELAKELGFDLIGFSKAAELDYEIETLEDWLSKGYNAGMKYMERNIDKRKDVSKILPGAQSVISLAINYFNNEEFFCSPQHGKVSRYAWGTDYHYIIWDKLKILESKLKKIDPNFVSKFYVDTGPVMDKVWAVKSGLGWMGKHSNLISRVMGSWLFIADIITNYGFEYNEPASDLCGTCTACIEACPTDAIIDNYLIDSNRCISYLTIENKGDIPDEFKGKFENWIFGCDICQDVCPWNKKFSRQTKEKEFLEIKNKELPLKEILEMNREEFKTKFKDSPITRAKLNGLQRNAKFLIDSSSGEISGE